MEEDKKTVIAAAVIKTEDGILNIKLFHDHSINLTSSDGFSTAKIKLSQNDLSRLRKALDSFSFEPKTE